MIADLQPVASKPEEANSSTEISTQAEVKQWLAKITAAKAKWKNDFDRMKSNMEFVSGLQWEGQTTIDDDKYTNNIALRMVNQKVATLYAKNPKAKAEPRPRLEYQVWDEDIESLMQAIQMGQQLSMTGQELPLEMMALFNDYQTGKLRKKLVKKLCKTIEILYQYQVDASKPEFKEQFKQLVRRAIICGVGFVRPIFCRTGEDYSQPSTVDQHNAIEDRMGRVQTLLSKIQEEGISEDSAEWSTLRSLVMSIGASELLKDEYLMPERIEFDFPPADSIIIDPRCRHIKDFVAAKWIAQEYILPVDDVNAIFGTDIEVGIGEGSAKQQHLDNPSIKEEGEQTDCKKDVALYEVFDKISKTRFFVVDGHKDYVLPPEPPTPCVSGFWQHFALSFNDVESGPKTKASIYPPSDVQLLKHPQKEWNRTRDSLRDHRVANQPKYLFHKGQVDDETLKAIEDGEPNTAIPVNAPPDKPLKDFFVRMEMAPIDEKLYDTSVLEQDMMLAVGMQQANVGPAQPNVTATVGTIAEQSRLNVSASNIDDLDGVLSRLAEACGQMMLQEMSIETVKRIAGPGALWPTSYEARQDAINEVLLTVEAASSGRPNKAIDVANWRDLAPLILQSGANPVGVIQETMRRLDDNSDATQFFPLVPPSGPALPSGNNNKQGGQSESSGGHTNQKQPPASQDNTQPTPPLAAKPLAEQ